MAIACLESRSTDLDILCQESVRTSSPGNSAPRCRFHGDPHLDYQFPESAGRWQDRCWLLLEVSSQRQPLSLFTCLWLAKCPADSPGDSTVAIFQKGSVLLSKAFTLVTSPYPKALKSICCSDRRFGKMVTLSLRLPWASGQLKKPGL